VTSPVANYRYHDIVGNYENEDPWANEQWDRQEQDDCAQYDEKQVDKEGIAFSGLERELHGSTV
jgi:hypothetical protein